MLDFELLRTKKMTLNELVANLGVDNLRKLTTEMVGRMLALIASCTDPDVVFKPLDPAANDPHAARPEDVSLAWNLGHVIVHTTASSEEAAAIAAELARGVAYHGRSRSEIPWQGVASIAMCRQRLEESCRMRLASLDMWPGTPYLDNRVEMWGGMAPTNAVGRFVTGLVHDDSHLGQIAEIVRQAQAAHNKRP
jgi:hypothetical protein